MQKFDQQKAFGAVKDAMQETVATFGIAFVRNLSFFPSSRKVDEKQAA